MNLRVDPLNAKCLCYKCHLFWWHKEPLAAAEWFEEKWPGRYKQLLAKKLDTFDMKIDWKAKYEEFKVL